MKKFEYKDGSQKQNEWASSIASEWMAEYDQEIANNKLRPESDGMGEYISILEDNRKKLLAGFEKITAKALIEMYVAKRNVASVMIDQSRKQYKSI